MAPLGRSEIFSEAKIAGFFSFCLWEEMWVEIETDKINPMISMMSGGGHIRLAAGMRAY
jgi:hypothetical protein